MRLARSFLARCGAARSKVEARPVMAATYIRRTMLRHRPNAPVLRCVCVTRGAARRRSPWTPLFFADRRGQLVGTRDSPASGPPPRTRITIESSHCHAGGQGQSICNHATVLLRMPHTEQHRKDESDSVHLSTGSVQICFSESCGPAAARISNLAAKKTADLFRDCWSWPLSARRDGE